MKHPSNIVILILICIILGLISIWLNNSEFKRVQALVNSRFDEQKIYMSTLFENYKGVVEITND